MRHARRSLRLMLVAGLALAGAAWAVPASAAAAPAASIWTVTRTPNIGSDVNDLMGVAAASERDVWAVGFARGASLHYRTLIQRFDGTAWKVVSSPNAGTDDFLNGVATLGSTDAWAVGRSFVGAANQTLAEHWDGTAWSIVATPNGIKQNSALSAVDVITSNDVWAVGYTNTLSSYSPLAMHWDGSSWTLAPVTGGGLFFSTVAIASNDVWAVGETKPDGLTLTQHWNGTSWSTVQSPNGSGENLLSGASGVASSDVWAVGVQAEGTRTLAEHWNGTAWQIVTTPDPLPASQGNSVLVAITAISATDAWAVGLTIDFTKGELEQSVTEHWDGVSWTTVASPDPGSGSVALFGAGSLPNGRVWAVGARHTTSTPYDRTLAIRTTQG